MRILGSESGLTLLEIAIGTALLSTSMVVAVMSYTSISKLQQKGIAVRGVQQSSRYALESIARDIRNADVVDIPNNNGTSMSLTNSFSSTNRVDYSYNNQQILRSDCQDANCSIPTSILSESSRAESVNYELVQPVGGRAYIIVRMRVVQAVAGLSSVDPFSKTYDLSTVVTLRGK